MTTWATGSLINADTMNLMVRSAESYTRIAFAQYSSATGAIVAGNSSGFVSATAGSANVITFTLTTPFSSKYVYLYSIETTDATYVHYKSAESASAVTVTLATGTGAYKINVLAIGI